MKGKFKRIISFVLSICMVLTMVPHGVLTAYASNEVDTYGIMFTDPEIIEMDTPVTVETTVTDPDGNAVTNYTLSATIRTAASSNVPSDVLTYEATEAGSLLLTPVDPGSAYVLVYAEAYNENKEHLGTAMYGFATTVVAAQSSTPADPSENYDFQINTNNVNTIVGATSIIVTTLTYKSGKFILRVKHLHSLVQA